MVADATHVDDSKPIEASGPATSAQPTIVPDTFKHSGPRPSKISPVVCVVSVRISSLSAAGLSANVQLPVTSRVPPAVASEQPMPSADRSAMPPTLRHESTANQLPTTSPPQPVTLSQEASGGSGRTLEPMPPPPEVSLALEPPLAALAALTVVSGASAS